MIKKVSKHIVQNEDLLFEQSSPGKIGYQLPPLDVPAVDAEEALGDLLTDLMHWSDRSGFDFDAALERARTHYEAETAGEEAP